MAKSARVDREPAINSDWFRKAIKDCARPQSELAGLLGITPAQISKLLQGVRRVQINEVPIIAKFLGKTNAEVLINLGIVLDGGGSGGPIQGGRSVPVVGQVEADGTVSIDLDHPTRRIDAPGIVPPGTVAIAASIPGHDASNFLIGGMFFVRISDKIEPSAIGRLSLVRAIKGPWMLRTIKPAIEHDRYDLIGTNGTLEGQELMAASPVALIRP